MINRLLFAALAVALAPRPASAPGQIIHAPAQVVAGDPVAVRIIGLPPGAEVEVAAERGTRGRLRAAARFRADRSGRVDLARDAPVSGDYAGRDAAGLFWSMRPIVPAGPAPATPGDGLHLTVRTQGRILASADVSILSEEPGLITTAVDGFAGAKLYRREAKKPQPVAILLGGSEGGDGFGKAMVPFITRQGYAALVLPYYAPSWVATPELSGLPADFADIPVDRLDAVRTWIAGRKDLDARRIVVVGGSKGGEFAMLAAAHFPWLRAVVGFVPSDVVWEGWGPAVTGDDTRSSFAWQGRPLSYVPYKGMRALLASFERGDPGRMADVHTAGRAANPDRVPAATIAVEKFRGPMMVIGAGQDAIWPSAAMVREIARRRHAAGLSTELMVFPHAGHNLTGGGWDAMRAFGEDDTAAASAHAQIEIRARLARFLRDVR